MQISPIEGGVCLMNNECIMKWLNEDIFSLALSVSICVCVCVCVCACLPGCLVAGHCMQIRTGV